MAEKSEALNPDTWNYFNYFTEVEDHFQKARGTGLFLMSPLDWALVESWKNTGIPLEAVLRGIDEAFTKRQSKKPSRSVNSVAWCSQAVQEAADALSGSVPLRTEPVAAPFTLDELTCFLSRTESEVRLRGGYEGIADALGTLRSEAELHYANLETLEQRLTALEEKMSAMARAQISEENLFLYRRQLETTLRPYRSKMSSPQLSMLERQYLDRRIQEEAGLPRLSLFYLK